MKIEGGGCFRDEGKRSHSFCSSPSTCFQMLPPWSPTPSTHTDMGACPSYIISLFYVVSCPPRCWPHWM